MLAVGTGWSRSRRARRASAGGQLEQPSEVKSSTRTGVRVGEGWAAASCAAETGMSHSGRREAASQDEQAMWSADWHWRSHLAD